MNVVQRIPTTAPAIPPVENVEDRPLWSIMIPSYNNVTTIAETLRSVVEQQQPNMEIWVVDDASENTDIIEQKVAQYAKHNVRFFRQAQNVGSLRNFETCIKKASGNYIHLLHADDYVLPGFYEKMEKLLQQHPSAGAAFCQFRLVDNLGKQLSVSGIHRDTPGILNDWLLNIARAQHIQYCSMVVKREVYEHLGAFHSVVFGEDWEMWVRIAAHYPVAFHPDILAAYRHQDVSISGKAIAKGHDLRDLNWVINYIQQYLPEDKKDELKRISCRYYAKEGRKKAIKFLDDGQCRAARAQLFHSMLMYPSFQWIRKNLTTYIRTFVS